MDAFQLEQPINVALLGFAAVVFALGYLVGLASA